MLLTGARKERPVVTNRKLSRGDFRGVWKRLFEHFTSLPPLWEGNVTNYSAVWLPSSFSASVNIEFTPPLTRLASLILTRLPWRQRYHTNRDALKFPPFRTLSDPCFKRLVFPSIQEKIWLDFGESRGEVKGIGKFFLKIIKDSFKLKIGYEEISSLLNRVFKKSNVKIINNKERWYRILVDGF